MNLVNDGLCCIATVTDVATTNHVATDPSTTVRNLKIGSIFQECQAVPFESMVPNGGMLDNLAELQREPRRTG